MKLIHMSDIHLTAPGQTIGGRDPNANFERALAHALADHADAELLVITGDLSDWGDREDYVRLKARLGALPIPARVCIGNHDDRTRFLEVFPEARDGDGFAQSVLDTSAGRCLFLDTWGPETHAGHFCAARQAWLEARLEEHGGPFLIFMHHNPIPTHLGPMDQIRLLEDVAFRRIIARHAARIRHIFFGHCHMPLAGSTAGVPTTSLRGTNHASIAIFGEKHLLSASDLPEAYGVAFVGPDYVTVHMIEFGYSGPVRIEGSPDYAHWNRESMTR
ncbi:MAG: phosphodiesterase [Hyphomicrobiaceae bacterium]|nr:phosphodiesterase [Hyphomicrobiaceae bacterium]